MRIGVVSVAGDIFPPLRMRYFIEKGYDVHYIGILPSLKNPNFKINGFTYETVGASFERPWLLSMFEIALKVREIAKRRKLDILHIIDMAYCLCAPLSAAKITVLENNGSDILVASAKSVYLPYLYKFCYKFADAIIQDSVVVQEAAFQLGAHRDNNEVIELGTDFDVFNLNLRKGVMRAKYNLRPERKIVLSPRSFNKLYNIDVIVKSIPHVKKYYNDVIYVLCGYNVSIDNDIKNMARMLGVDDNVIYAGSLDRKADLPYYYTDADVVVSVPSSDSMPASVLEAMACGTPVIISELPWYKNIFTKDEDLMAIPVHDQHALGDMIIRVLSGNFVMDHISIFNKIREQYNINKLGTRLEWLYDRLLLNRALI